MFDVPILFIVFNRPEKTRQVFSVLKKIQPSRLFIVADGPRSNRRRDRILCEKTRRIVRDISWKCDVTYRMRKTNIGCGKGEADAIGWFFAQVTEGIILEDDCLPDETFFPFCKELLVRYRNNHRVMHISGDNFQGSGKRGKESYYFSIFPHAWGWATWRRAWKYYNYSLFGQDMGIIEKYFSKPNDVLYWIDRFRSVLADTSDSWDYQWMYALWKQKGLSVIPQYNLVTNIGMDARATHTKQAHYLRMPPASMPFPLVHPTIMQADKRADEYTQQRVFSHRPSWYEKISLFVNKFML